MAEIKRASPSRGDIAPDIDAAEQARRYAAAGAAVISVLTEPHWFKGSLADLERARAALEPLGAERPALLRKDFILDPYQVAEARAAGADAVLLIVACLDDAALRELLAETRAYGMEALVEVNSGAEMERAAAAGARFVGINNRNLHDFRVDLATTERLAAQRPPGALLAALSGIERREDVERFARAGAEAVLVGEALMRAEDPGALIREFAAVPVMG
jgi:anthranilate synthase/indole-3-glycerol phosphate synthase/phosphoribosylanthranilate isomerase